MPEQIQKQQPMTEGDSNKHTMECHDPSVGSSIKATTTLAIFQSAFADLTKHTKTSQETLSCGKERRLYG